MQLAEQLSSAGLAVFPCRQDKAPAVPKGTDWRDAAQLPPADQHWPSGVVGIPIPAGCVVIDLDTYKGVTRGQVEQVLGCSLPWDAAMIQHTQRGGQHYGFSVDWAVKQGSDIAQVRGFDTRTAGNGYIATGAGYSPSGFGLYALAHPAALPRLPDACRAVLERVQAERPDTTAPTPYDTATETVVQALSHIDPAGSRSEWLKIGLALRSHFGEDPEGEGFALFDRWSAGGLTPGGECPHNYNVDDQAHQWGSFKADGATTLGSLFYAAVQGGWTPPAGIDTAAAFGAGAASADQFAALVDRFHEHGGDPKHTETLIGAVTALGGNQLQAATLLALLQRELKDAGLLTPPIRAMLNTAAGGSTPQRAAGQYGKNHTENATLYVERHHPNGTLLRSDQVWYAYTGKAWAELCDDDVKHTVAVDLAPSFPQLSVTKGTYGILEQLCHSRGKSIGDIAPGLILYQNGVLDLHTGALTTHTPDHFTTNILPYDFLPGAQCPLWLGFLSEVFEGDQERIALIQEWFGYMLATSYAHHKIMMLIGPPRCGKGTIGRMLERVVGAQNYTGGSLIDFKNPAFLDSLTTKLVMFSGDTAKRVHPSVRDVVTEQIKKISGNDAVTFDRKYKSVLSRALPTRITLAANQKPHLFDDSGALAGRMLFLPFDVTFAGREDIGLFDRLALEVEGVAVWALQGMARLNSAGRFTVPAASLVEREDMEALCSPLAPFIESQCTFGTGRTTVAALAEAYQAWHTVNAVEHPLSAQNFAETFRDATRGRCRKGAFRFDDKVMKGYDGLTLGPVTSATSAAFNPQLVK